jgi:hypothetical protein
MKVASQGKLEAVRVRLLGGFRVSVGSRTIEENGWQLKKAASLVKLLTLAPGHRLHRERVMDVLWPDLVRKRQPTIYEEPSTSPVELWGSSRLLLTATWASGASSSRSARTDSYG